MAEQRFEMYRPIHKVVRHAMFSTSHAIGAADFRDEESTQEAFGKLDKVITLLQVHAEHESNFVHPALESKVPGITAPFAGNHEEDERVYAQLGDLTRRAHSSVGDERVALGKQVYSLFNKFVGDYLGHLDREENELESALLEHYTDAELSAIDQAIMGSVPPEQMADWLPLFCSSMNVDDLIMGFSNFKSAGPPEAVEWALQVAEQAMPGKTWEKVRARIT